MKVILIVVNVNFNIYYIIKIKHIFFVLFNESESDNEPQLTFLLTNIKKY